jgi:plasmid stabilization system protein ParE
LVQHDDLARVGFHPEAAAEAEAASNWYLDRSERAALAFRAEIDRAIRLISEAPDQWPLYVDGTRRFLLRRFPFSLVYRQVTTGLQVVAVAHAKRLPGYWRIRESLKP